MKRENKLTCRFAVLLPTASLGDGEVVAQALFMVEVLLSNPPRAEEKQGCYDREEE